MSSRPCSPCPTTRSARSCASSTGRSGGRSGWRWRLVASCVVALALAACSQPSPSRVEVSPLERVQAAAAELIVPVVVDTREAIEAVIPPPQPALPPAIHSDAVALIAEFEVTSPAYYDRKLQAPVWPGGASGATWGIGYDGGHQTRRVILDDWAAHAHVEQLAGTAGVVGIAARELLPGLREARTPYPYAVEVFESVALPRYHRGARTTYGGDLFDRLPLPAQGALVSLQYNRGAPLPSHRGNEQRHIRDVCVPAVDVHCIAVQLRTMCRLWKGTANEAGLCRRRNAEADLAERPT